MTRVEEFPSCLAAILAPVCVWPLSHCWYWEAVMRLLFGKCAMMEPSTVSDPPEVSCGSVGFDPGGSGKRKSSAFMRQ